MLTNNKVIKLKKLYQIKKHFNKNKKNKRERNTKLFFLKGNSRVSKGKRLLEIYMTSLKYVFQCMQLAY